MPQLLEYPFLPSGDPEHAVNTLIAVCRAVPAEGETYRAFRGRLRDAGLWDKDRVGGFQAFFRVPGGPQMVPSALMRAIAATDSDDDAAGLIAERMWDANPILLKTVIERLSERVSPPGELYSFLDSFAYRGTAVPRRELLSWVQMARGVGILARVGIALGIGEAAPDFIERARHLDFDEYAEEDEPEPELGEAVFAYEGAAPAAAAAEAAAAPRPVLAEPSAPMTAPAPEVPPAVRRAASALGSPLGHEPAVPLSSVAASGRFAADVLGETTARLERWWTAGDIGADDASPADFGIDAESWMESAEVAMYRLAVAAAFRFRLPAPESAIREAYRALEAARVLDDLYYGTAPDELPAGVDSRALMLASLVARRLSEVPDLAADLERQSTAREAFAVLEAALGRGLFEIELFWLMRALRDVGAIRFDDIDDYTALPTRRVRDGLFRLGFLESPYADGIPALCAAAAAAHAAVGDSGPPEQVLGAFTVAAGCDYGCQKRKSCDFACRERLG